MNIGQLANIYNEAKQLKCSIIVVCGGKIMGTDESMSIFRDMQINDLSIQLAYDQSEVQKLLEWCEENIKQWEDIDILDDVQFMEYLKINDTVIRLPKKFYIRIPFYHGRIMQSFSNIAQILMKPPELYLDDVRTDPKFEEIMNYKAGDGVYFYRTNGYTLTLYKTLLSITKKDKIALSIYDNGLSFLAKYSVIKSKTVTINHYVLYKKV